MRKLDDIPKKSPFKVPEGYFDQLPSVIQSRMTNEQRRSGMSPAWGLSFKFALPVIALLVAGILWFRPAPSIESQLDEIDTEQIAFYLDNAERVDTDETHDGGEWTTTEIDELENTVFSNMNDDELDNLDLDNL